MSGYSFVDLSTTVLFSGLAIVCFVKTLCVCEYKSIMEVTQPVKTLRSHP